jgi:hypothetical protein
MMQQPLENDVKIFLNNCCCASGVKKIYEFVCNHKPIPTALEKLGFEKPGSIDVVYEKRIR